MVFHNRYISEGALRLRRKTTHAFTFVEAIVAVTLIGIGIATALTALTKINSIASMARNSTGAYTLCQNKIDAILVVGPFNPQKTNFDGTKQIPPELVLDSQRSPAGPLVEPNLAVYQDPVTGVVVTGTRSTSVTDVSTTYYGITMYMYQATVTVSYQYLNRAYSYSMNTVRTSDI